MPNISFNRKDYNLKKVEITYPLQNYISDGNYRIYGLVNENNPLVMVESKRALPKEAQEALQLFFSTNGIQVEFGIDDSMRPDVSIGLRKDLRGYVSLCGAIISTIIANLEGKLTLDIKENLIGIPRFNQ